MSTKIKRRDFIKATAAAGAAALVSPLDAGALARGPAQGGAPSPRPLTSYDNAAREILSRMTLEEKVGQMTQAEQDALKEPDDIRGYAVGSLLSGGSSDPSKGGVADNSLLAWTDMYDRYQTIAMKSRLGIPILYGVDAVHGHNNVLGAVIFPHNIGLGCARSPRLVEEAARVTAEEVRATGIQWTFAPCVAVPRDERWGRTYEGFGESPELAASLGEAAVRGLQRNDLSDPLSVLACAKHYVGDGGTVMGTGDRDELSLPAEDLAAVDNLKRAGVPVVAVLVTGRPLILEPILAKCEAVVVAWLPGTEGQGVADVLFGDYRPTGKLSFTWPRTDAQIPINVGDRPYDPLFKYGYGLTY